MKLANYNTLHRSEDGFVLVTSMLVMVAVSLLGVAALNTTIFEIMIAGNEKWSQEQFFRADSAINMMLAKAPVPPDESSDKVSNIGSCRKLIDDNENVWKNNILRLPVGEYPVYLFYLQKDANDSDIYKIRSCAKRENTIVSLTVGVELDQSVSGGGIINKNDVGYN